MLVMPFVIAAAFIWVAYKIFRLVTVPAGE